MPVGRASSRWRNVSAGLLRLLPFLGLLVVFAVSALAQLPKPTPPPPQEPGFEMILADLGGRKFDKRLPFDIPFVIAGKVPPNTQVVGVQYALSSKKTRFREFQPNWMPRTPILWRHLPDLDEPDEKDRLLFRVLMPPLEPERYYQFRFWITPTESQTREFKDAATKVVDGVLGEVRSVRLKGKELGQLQEALLGALLETSGTKEFLGGGTFFDLGASEEALAELEAKVEPILEFQDKLRSSWSAYLVGQSKLGTQLVQLRDNAQLDKLLELSKQSSELLQQYTTLLMQLQAEKAGQAGHQTGVLGVPDNSRPGEGVEPGGAETETAARAVSGQPAGTVESAPENIYLEELLGNLQEQVQRFTRISKGLAKLPGLVARARAASEAIRNAEAVFLQGSVTFDISSVSALDKVLSSKRQADVKKLISAYGEGELAFAPLLGMLTTPDMADLLGLLVGTKELSPGFSEQERVALQELVSNTGALTQALERVQRLQSNIRGSLVSFNERRSAIGILVDEVAKEAHDKVPLLASTFGIVETERRNYISADVGVLYGWNLGAAYPYVGVNLYFRPINKEVPLKQKGGLARRFSLMLGVTVTSVSDGQQGQVGTRENLFLSQALVFGAGFRVTGSLRAGGGMLLFLKEDPNPLIDDTSLAVSPYVSASLDLNVMKAASKIGKAVGKLFK